MLTAFALVAAALLLAHPGHPVEAWWVSGHRILAKAAALALPDESPAFLREGGKALAAYSGDPDAFKNRGTPHLSRTESPEHYIDLEFFEGIELPEGRSNYMRRQPASPHDPPQRPGATGWNLAADGDTQSGGRPSRIPRPRSGPTGGNGFTRPARKHIPADRGPHGRLA